MTKKDKLIFKASDDLLEVIDNQNNVSRSDLQGKIDAIVRTLANNIINSK